MNADSETLDVDNTTRLSTMVLQLMSTIVGENATVREQLTSIVHKEIATISGEMCERVSNHVYANN